MFISSFGWLLAGVMSGCLAAGLVCAGWISTGWTTDDEELFRQLFQRLLVSASHFPVGSIIERDGHLLKRRAQTEPLQVPGPG